MGVFVLKHRKNNKTSLKSTKKIVNDWLGSLCHKNHLEEGQIVVLKGIVFVQGKIGS